MTYNRHTPMRRTVSYLVIIMMWFGLLFFTDIFTNPKSAKQALLNASYHPIEIGGRDNFACGRDLFSTKFTAYTPDSSRIVSGVVCSGLFKGNTIRTF